MSQTPEQTPHQRTYTGGNETDEKDSLHNIPSVNADRNNNYILLHTYQNGQVQNPDNTKCQNVEQQQLSSIAGGDAKCFNNIRR